MLRHCRTREVRRAQAMTIARMSKLSMTTAAATLTSLMTVLSGAVPAPKFNSSMRRS